MMSEHQSRKMNVSRDPIQRPTDNMIKASDDVALEKTPARLKSKNTLPKNLRYDLENALVGLCDVWFEEIKPYLERNNIKVHVHEPVAGNGQGDSARGAPGAGAADCAHLHPGRSYRRQRRGASCAASCSTPLTASRAPCRRPPVPPRPTTSTLQSKRNESNEETYLKAVIRKTRKKKPKDFLSKRLVPRLCETYSLPAEIYQQQTMEPAKAMISKQKSHHRNDTKIGRAKNKPELKDVSTQTETLLMIKTVKPVPRKSLKSGCHFSRSPAITVFLPSKNKNNSIKDPNQIKILDAEVPPLFKNDLIDIIGEKHDKMLRVLYRSPDTSGHSSSLNLFSPYKPGKKSASSKKTRPWR
ncbi:uncharacterized protein LOC123873879 [Maniola jurtina]|uniref:uncharacterized protein LOC123873879 n=1 Tax=Maniola jurtina TaxID=191418 RepID=UPI001E68B314|nr:uncharacterized protein LOC123873879 [Maniola jurtina]